MAASVRKDRHPPHTSETSLGPHLVALASTPNFQLSPSQHRRQLIFANLPVSADDTRADDRIFLVHVLPLNDWCHPQYNPAMSPRTHTYIHYMHIPEKRQGIKPVSSQSARESEETPRNSDRTVVVSSRRGTYFTDGKQILLKRNIPLSIIHVITSTYLNPFGT